LSDGSAAPDRDRLAAFQVAEIRGHVAGRENVRQEQHLIVAQSRGDLDGTDVSEWNAQIFRLAAGKSAEQMRIAEQSGGRMTPQLFGLLRIRVGALAAGIKAALAEEALPA
jgi:hypothetical protein